MTEMLSCPTDFFVGNKLIVLNSALSSTGSRNIEEEVRQRKRDHAMDFSLQGRSKSKLLTTLPRNSLR